MSLEQALAYALEDEGNTAEAAVMARNHEGVL